MDNAEEVFHFLEEFSKRKPKTIPQELNDYLAYVARTGDPLYQWSLVKSLFKEKFLNVITDFYETSPGIDIPPYPNVDPFNYDIMKNSLLERLDSFTSAPFTVQRICELLTFPRKQYNRIDKYMRAIEKNILVVSTREPGIQRHVEPENGEQVEPIVNGSDNNSEYNVDVEMEDMSWKENSVPQSSEPQPSSSDAHISVDDVETQDPIKQDTPLLTPDKQSSEEEMSQINVVDEALNKTKPCDEPADDVNMSNVAPIIEVPTTSLLSSETNKEEDVKHEITPSSIIIPEIKIDDADMTEQKLTESKKVDSIKPPEVDIESGVDDPENKDSLIESEQQTKDGDSTSVTITKEESENKHVDEILTSSEESSSSNDNVDTNSNSPVNEHENNIVSKDELEQSESNSLEHPINPEQYMEVEQEAKDSSDSSSSENFMQSDNSISDTNSTILESTVETINEPKESTVVKVEESVPEPTLTTINNEKDDKSSDEQLDS